MTSVFLSEDSPEFREIYEQWKTRARSIKTIDEFNEFYNHLFNDYLHDYGTMCRAIGQLSVAAASLGAHIEGITGFQAGFVKWEFLHNWTYKDNKTGLKITDYDYMLYPQYAYRFDKTISPETWEALQKEARRKLDDGRGHPAVIEHWRSIVNGEVPFGYKVRRE